MYPNKWFLLAGAHKASEDLLHGKVDEDCNLNPEGEQVEVLLTVLGQVWVVPLVVIVDVVYLVAACNHRSKKLKHKRVYTLCNFRPLLNPEYTSVIHIGCFEGYLIPLKVNYRYEGNSKFIFSPSDETM